MRFNKQELMSLASQPSQKFDKEGVLLVKERQEGFFRRTEISTERWCRLRGNMLFYFKSREQWSEPAGVIILEHCTVKMDQSQGANEGPYGFLIVFEGGLSQQLAALSPGERQAWVAALQLAGYDAIRSQVATLRQKLDFKHGGREIELDVHIWRARRGRTIDPCEAPLCELSLSCDNLLCDGHGRPPNPLLALHVFMPTEGRWVRYARTEMIQRNSNPSFLHTAVLRASDGLTADTRLRISAYDVREPVSHTSTLLGRSELKLGALIKDGAGRSVRLPLKSINTDSLSHTTGFVTASSWTLEVETGKTSSESTPCKSPSQQDTIVYSHRRSQSLPSRLGAKLRLPNQGELRRFFASPHVRTYRFHSGLGGDICVHETMAESKLCFSFPQQLLSLWIQEEKELLQEVAGMGELREPWHSRQVQLLDRSLHLLHLYSQAKQNLQSHRGNCFKPSSRKADRSLEFAPINLHLQRLWVQNDTLRRSGLYDIVTVGAFTAHAHKCKTGGLLKLLQQMKESPTKHINDEQQAPSKISMAHDAIQAIKQLRREVVESMRSLMKLAKEKQTLGMVPICDDMIKKTRILLSLWDSALVEHALSFMEEHKVSPGPPPGPDDILTPYRRLTQQLHGLSLNPLPEDELLSPDLNTPAEDKGSLMNYWPAEEKSDTESDPKVCEAEESHLEEICLDAAPTENKSEEVSPSNDFVFVRAEKDCRDALCGLVNGVACKSRVHEDAGTPESAHDEAEDDDEEEEELRNLLPVAEGPDALTKQFLDTQAMCNSPTANYYKPTDEPEPWDLTQLNIEASMMCLVSKVKFLCGRVGSPAVRLRSQTVKKFQPLSGGDDVEVPEPPQSSVKKVNKFTEGLDFATMVDWGAELRPSMKKLRQAMDGLLKTARLTHSVMRVKQDAKAALRACTAQYRRDVCFAQALTSLVTGLVARLWCSKPDPAFLLVLSTLGPLAEFEGMLSYYGIEIAMWGDMVVAIEDLCTVTFTLVHAGSGSPNDRAQGGKRPQEIMTPIPRVTGSRAALTVLLPVPEAIFSMMPSNPASRSFRVTPVFFNIGINDMASLAESLGSTKPQDKSNIDNFDRLNDYYLRYRKLGIPSLAQQADEVSARRYTTPSHQPTVGDLMDALRASVHGKQNKNVEVLHLSARICRAMRGLRFTSCKSAKDRTGMSITLEQCSILASEYNLAEYEFQRALDCMRSEGCRRENTRKNTGIRKYAFNSLQVLGLPQPYRPPAGTYGSAQT